MKTKLFLMLFALNGLLLGANSASAAPANQSVASLSHTISNLVDLDADAQSLVELAINRALLAKNVKDNDKDLHIIGQQTINGHVANPNSGPTIGQVANPHHGPIINGKIVNPNHGPIINGRIANPHPKPPIDKEPPILINGIIYNPNQQPQRR
jgi:hypothetical protein